ncbi:putative reverse transcriptase domain-containing protein [Tanacetum coccineum]
MPNTRSRATLIREVVDNLIALRVAEALEARDAARNLKPLAKGGDEQGDENGGDYEGGNGECTYQDFLKCQSLNFNGMEGVVGLTRWFEKMETVFQELVLLYTRMVLNEEDKVERASKYQGKVEGCIRVFLVTRRVSRSLGAKGGDGSACKGARVAEANVMGCKGEPTRLEAAIRGANNLIDQKTKGNKTRNNEATTKACSIGGGGANPDSNVVTGTFLLNDCYDSMLFDLGSDRSFVSSTFSALLDVTPSTLDTSYAVELANGRISETNVILRGCTLGLLGHPFDIDLMPIEHGCFNVIISMDWLAKYHVVIVCDEKIVCIPYGDEVLRR